ncbi:universal stress protein [Mycolicibacterium wolinskyi]|uniref:universal stress protein n=1 Tax=Mycolicibacterium wolinskyi TaxID=59750 RepID=UPI0012FF74EF|nr:universal stress protein [Mycolicibacterium wolinskyi]
MADFAPRGLVVVGIDGSKSAVHAAIWASNEAMQRGAVLRLVHVLTADCRGRDRGYAHAGRVLHKAWIAVESLGRPIVVDSDVMEGDPVAELVEASRTADLLCVGARGTSDSRRRARGTTAAELAGRAYSPVSVVGRPNGIRNRVTGFRHHGRRRRGA